MIDGSPLSFFAEFSNKEIDHITVGCMYIDQSPAFSHFFHEPDHLPVIDHQGSFISHKCLERSNPFFLDHGTNFFRCGRIKIGNRHMKTIITQAIIFGS